MCHEGIDSGRSWSIKPEKMLIMEHASTDGLAAMPNDVLIVEDDPIIALDFEDTMLGLGVDAVRSATNVATALALIAERPPDFALLDVALARENSFVVAAKLDALNIPFVFVTGYDGDAKLPPASAGRPRLGKPCTSATLEAALRRAMGS